MLGWPEDVLDQRFSGSREEKLMQLLCLENHRERLEALTKVPAPCLRQEYDQASKMG